MFELSRHQPIRINNGLGTITVFCDPRLKPGQEIWFDMPEKPIASWYALDRDAGRTLYRRVDSVPVDLPPGKFYAIFEVDPGEVTELGSREVVVRAWSEDDPVSVAEFFQALHAAKNEAAVAIQRLENWFSMACHKCREMVVSNAATPKPTQGAKCDTKKRGKKVPGHRVKKSRPARRKVN